MNFDLQNLLRAVSWSLREPQQAAQEAILIKVEYRVLWTALALVAVLNAMLQGMLELLVPVPAEGQPTMPPPAVFAVLMCGFLAFNAYLTWVVGRMFGGHGDFAATLTLMVWFQVVSLSLTAVQFLLLVVMPPLGILFGVVSFVLLLRCMVEFVDVLHGFDHKGKAFGTALIALVVTVILGVIVLAVLGVEIPGGTI